MPLPLPNLDTRRWSDLVEEGRALIPRYAPEWTDHNVHDPGITLVELFAWLTEGAIYRANRVTDRSRRKFLSLLGYDPRAPRPANLVVAFRHAGGAARTLPAGLVLETPMPDAAPLRASLDLELTLVEAQLVSLFLLEGTALVDRSRALAAPLGLPLFGGDPAPGAGFALGFDLPLPPDTWVSLALELAGERVTRTERARFEREAAEQAAACRPPARDPCARPPRGCSCPDDPPLRRRHHQAHCADGAHSDPATVWEYFGAGGWIPIAEADLDDGTESLTWSGLVRLRIHGAMLPHSLGASAPRYWLRCRYRSGSYAAAPALVAIALNAATATQQEQSLMQFPVAVTAAITGGAPQPGTEAALDIRFDADGAIDSLGVDATAVGVPRGFIADYVAPAAFDGTLVLALVRLDGGSGLPLERVRLPDAPVAGLSLWSLEGGRWREWAHRVDLDASGPTDAHYVLDPTTGEISFGDGAHGRIVPEAAPLLADCRFTAGALGNLAPGAPWSVADTAVSRALLGAAFAAAVTDVASVTGIAIAVPGADEERFAEAAGRAAAALWAHEELVGLADAADSETLDGLDGAVVRAATAPARATTGLDYERLALDVPGTTVRRARAWASLDPDFPGVRALGTVTVMILPALPAARPMPGRRLLARVRRYLDRRRGIGTRLLVRGASYVEIRVTATVAATPGAEPARVLRDVAAALDRFLDPLRGGPTGRGWPFGRDVYRSELLQTIDDVRGVDHVEAMTMTADGELVECGNACVGPASLVAAGPHTITVSR